MNLKSFRFLNQFTQSPDGYFWDGEGETGTPGSPAPATSGAPAAAPTAAAPAPSVATTPAAQTPATGGPGEGWVPSYRVRETREAAYREAQAEARAEANRLVEEARQEAERYKSQLHRLVGVNPPEDPQVDAVKSQFAKLYPGLAKLEERAADLLGAAERAGDIEAQNEHYWQTYGRQTMDRLFTGMATTLGGQLTEEAKRSLHSSFVGFVQSSPELTARYANDPTIVDDFIKAFTSSFIDPVRRASTATVAGRAAAVAGLPQDTPGGAPQVAGPPKPKDLDERVAGAWAHYQTIAKQ